MGRKKKSELSAALSGALEWRPEAVKTLRMVLESIQEKRVDMKPLELMGCARVLAEALTASIALNGTGDGEGEQGK